MWSALWPVSIQALRSARIGIDLERDASVAIKLMGIARASVPTWRSEQSGDRGAHGAADGRATKPRSGDHALAIRAENLGVADQGAGGDSQGDDDEGLGHGRWSVGKFVLVAAVATRLFCEFNHPAGEHKRGLG